jgi:tRNA threonylcarbamoyl adenosine modification protein (Sua5/YciO/YrdC/YwlC family)
MGVAAERLDASHPDAVAAAAASLERGEVVGIPTETVYGLAVLPVAAALERLMAVKQRPLEKGIALLIDGLDQAEPIAQAPPAARALATQFWPGPLTLVLELRTGVGLPDGVTGRRSTVGLRLPDHPIPRALARSLGPIAVSSANVSGEPEARSADELLDRVGDRITLVIDDGPVRGGVPSSVVEIRPAGEWRVLREGALTVEALREAIQRAAEAPGI